MISRVFVKPIAMQWLKSWVHSDISQGWTLDPTGLLPVCLIRHYGLRDQDYGSFLMRMTPKADYFLKANIHYIPTPPLYYQKDIKPKHTTI